MKNRVSIKAGFTIVELLIVVVVIAILASITVVGYSGISSRSRDSVRASDVRNIKNALEMYKADAGVYPDVCGGMGVGCNASLLASALVPKYTSAIPQDMDTSRYYAYVMDGAGGRYGIRVHYENAPGLCKTGVQVVANWWGTGTPVCPN